MLFISSTFLYSVSFSSLMKKIHSTSLCHHKKCCHSQKVLVKLVQAMVVLQSFVAFLFCFLIFDTKCKCKTVRDPKFFPIILRKKEKKCWNHPVLYVGFLLQRIQKSFFWNTIHLFSFASDLRCSALYCRIVIMVPDRWQFPVGHNRGPTMRAACFSSHNSHNFLKLCY